MTIAGTLPVTLQDSATPSHCSWDGYCESGLDSETFPWISVTSDPSSAHPYLHPGALPQVPGRKTFSLLAKIKRIR